MRGIDIHARRPSPGGFTLVEVIVVVTTISLLLTLLLAGVQRVREAANRVTCQHNLKQLALAALLHHDAKGRFPTGVHIADVNGTTWGSELLPYLEQENLQQQLRETDSPEYWVRAKTAPTARVIKLLVCPSDRLPEPVQQCHACGEFYGVGCYAGNAGIRSFSGRRETRDGIFFPDSRIQVRDVADGASNTFLFGERSHRDKAFDDAAWYFSPDTYYPLSGLGKWANYCCPAHHLLSTAVPINYQTPPWPYTVDNTGLLPSELRDRIDAFGSGHPGGANFAFADGSVRFLSERTSLTALQALSTRKGGEMVEAP